MTNISHHQLAELILRLSTGNMSRETALRLADSLGNVEQFARGANLHGKFAEVIALCARDSLTDPTTPWVMVNAPSVPENFVRTWLNPDSTSTRDLLYEIKVSSTRHILVPGTQVKVGSATYVARSLLRHASDPRYGRVCDVDARLVCPDGSPRIAPDAFTRGQAAALKKAGFKFVGIEHLETDAKRMHAGIKGAYEQKLAAYERDLIIRANYGPRQVAFRAGIAGGMSFILTAGVSSYQQYRYCKNAVQNGDIDDSSETRKEYAKQAAKTVAKQAAISGGITVAGVATEAAVFHFADKFMPTEKAQTAATIAVAAAYASLDIVHEIVAYKRGEISGTEAAICGGITLAANAIPILLHVVVGRPGSAIGTVVSAGIRRGLGYVRREIRSSCVIEAA